MGQPNSQPALKIKGTDVRATKYGEIAKVHASLVEAKWRAQTTGVPTPLTPMDLAGLIMHCEASIAFLAQELLKLGQLVESGQIEE